MVDDYRKILEKFGISPTSAKVYLALLELGKASADGIAKRVGTYKANVYDALDRLMEAGLATSVQDGNTRLYFPTDPHKLSDAVDEAKNRELAKFEGLRKDIERITPKLSAMYGRVKEKDVFEIYRGKRGYKAMISDIRRENPKYWKGFGNLQVQEWFPLEFAKWFRGTKFMLFATKSEAFLRRLEEARKSTQVEIRYLPEELHMQVVWTLFGENLLILIYEPDIVALRIKSGQIVKTFANEFDYLWKKHGKNAVG